MSDYLNYILPFSLLKYDPMIFVTDDPKKSKSKRSGGADYKRKRSNKKYLIKAKLKRRRK